MLLIFGLHMYVNTINIFFCGAVEPDKKTLLRKNFISNNHLKKYYVTNVQPSTPV